MISSLRLSGCLLGASGCPWVLLAPPSPVWARGCLHLGSGQKQIFQLKRSHEMSIEMITFVVKHGATMDAQSLKNVITNKSGITNKNRVGTCEHERDNICTNRCPLRLDFDAPSLHGITVPTYPDLLNPCQTWWPKASEIDSYGCLREHKDRRRERFRKHIKTSTHTNTNICHKY